MVGSSSASSRSRDSKQDEGASLDSIHSSDAPENNDIIKNGLEPKADIVRDWRGWTLVCPSGNTPQGRYNHSAAVIGRKMLVVGGESDYGLLSDVQQLHLGKLSWSGLGTKPSSNTHSLKTRAAQAPPPCRGHTLIAWGQRLLLVTGQTEPPMATVSVWSFDTETENWSKIEAKGEVPLVRSGHSVTRAGSVLILFGGEDIKGRKLNDLHMFDLKSSTWLPLLAMGAAPCPRSHHVAAIYDDRLLLVFGGASKSKSLNDLYALDFEAMEWSRLKTRGVSPGPRAESAGVLFKDKWYIAGGGSSDTRCLETVMLDIARMTWSVIAQSDINAPSASKGFSMVVAQRKQRAFLVAFGGKRIGTANEVEVLHISAEEPERTKISSEAVTAAQGPSAQGPPRVAAKKMDLLKTTVSAPKENVITDDDPGGRAGGVVTLCEQFQVDDDGQSSSHDASMGAQGIHPGASNTPGTVKVESKSSRDTDVVLPLVSEEEARGDVNIDTGQADSSEERKPPPLTELRMSYEKKLAAAITKCADLEGQLKASGDSRDEAERSLAAVIRSRHKAEKRLAIALKENEDLKEKLAAAELAQEESINLTNVVHAENLRLDHDLAFLKAVLEDTQKELQTTRGVLSSERSRAFQLQVELFELKQTIQAFQRDNQTPS